MMADAMKDVSSRGGIVLDLFGGSGSTLIAAHKTGRPALASASTIPFIVIGLSSAGRPMQKMKPNRSLAESSLTATGGRRMTQPDKTSARPHLPTKQADYDVGYAKPPLATRFRRGQSGNPSGRRKGSIKKGATLPALNDERLKTIILEEAYRSISINDPNGQIDIPMAQAVVRSLAVNAAKGNQRAQRLFTELLTSVERDNKKLHDEWLQTAINYKVEWDEELARRKEIWRRSSAADTAS